MDAVKRIAKTRGIPKRELYRRVFRDGFRAGYSAGARPGLHGGHAT